MADKEEKKLIVDEDWKQEAKREKEILTQQEKQEKEQKTAHGRTGPLPEADFAGLMSMLTTQAFFALGVIRAKEEEQKEPDLEMAKYNIDMLDVLQDKTKGNLSDQERKALEDTLHQLRMLFVQMSGK